MNANNIKKGSVIKLKGEIYLCLEFQHVKPGKGGAFVRTKLKMLPRGSLVDKTFRSEEKVEEVYVERKKVQYIYKDADNFVLMDLETYEQFNVLSDIIGSDAKFLIEGMEFEAYFYNLGVISIVLPIFVERKVIHTEPGVRGDTVTTATKQAKIEGGYTLQVPLFVNVDDLLKIDTRTGNYIMRIIS